MTQNNIAGVIGIGSFVPNWVVKNEYFSNDLKLETSDEWIRTRTGIQQRRIATKDISTVDMAYNASVRALENANIKAEDLDLIIVGTYTPDMYTPSVSCMIQGRLGAKNAAAFDLNAACSGFMYGLTVANQFIKTGMYKNILVVGADKNSSVMNWRDRGTCILFGDAAGAVVVSNVEKGLGIIQEVLGADGIDGNKLTCPNLHITQEDLDRRGGENPHSLWMDGGEIYKFAVKIVDTVIEDTMTKAGLTVDDIKLIVPHQANIRIIEGIVKKLKISMDKMYCNVQNYGNTSAASIPLALDEAVKLGKINKGDKILLIGFGGGLTWGCSIIEF